jgi:LAO/AO transport system kinase
MVLSPHAGDSIQAMKAGLMETADIYVVNKADLPDAQRSAVEIRATIARDRPEGAWQPPVILTSTTSGAGLGDLSAALDAHRSQVAEKRDPRSVLQNRLRHHLGEVLMRKLQAAIEEADFSSDIAGATQVILDHFNASAVS